MTKFCIKHDTFGHQTFEICQSIYVNFGTHNCPPQNDFGTQFG